jgi:predicted transcriptional regulator
MPLSAGEFNVRRVQVESLDQFRIMAQRPVEVYVLLGDGTVHSSKRVQYQHNRNGRHWWMYESVGDSERYYTERQFTSDTNIVEAIGKAALYVEVDPDG